MFFGNDSVLVDLIGVFKIRRSASVLRIAHDRHYDSLSVRTAGSGSFTCDGRQYTVQTGDFIYLPQTKKYSQETAGESIIAIHFIRYSSEKRSEVETVSPENREEAMALTQSMYKLWTEKKTGYKQACMALLYQLLYLLRLQTEKESVSAVGTDKIPDSIIDYMHKNYRKEKISVAYLAEMASVSEAYFRRVFKSIYGISPARYIINLKLEYASGLLQSGFYNVTETAEKAGFADVKYFQRLFKQHFGQTPASYKRLNLEHMYK
ncbi:MAG: AraC family transcriptional regulator [Clostridia bacterium]|nr:AraC family transcriptional regulator [Clostridia bacterium]